MSLSALLAAGSGTVSSLSLLLLGRCPLLGEGSQWYGNTQLSVSAGWALSSGQMVQAPMDEFDLLSI